MAFTGTPAAERCEAAVTAAVGSLITGIGQYNRRKIAGTNTWSQHSWGNANDFHVSSLQDGDVVYAFLNTNRKALGIRVLLWRVTSHFDHLHADYWPKGVNTPPLSSTGRGDFQYSDGRKVRAKIQLVPPEGEGVETMSSLKRGDSGDAVKYYQKALNAVPNLLPEPLTTDGAFGPATEDAVRRYQRAADLTETGTIDGVEGYLIGRYNLESGEHNHDGEYLKGVTGVK